MENKSEATELFKALGDPTRLRILDMLSCEEQDDLSVSDLAQKLGISQPATSQHMKILRNIGIVEAHRKGFRVFYNVHRKALASHKARIDGLFNTLFRK